MRVLKYVLRPSHCSHAQGGFTGRFVVGANECLMLSFSFRIALVDTVLLKNGARSHFSRRCYNLGRWLNASLTVRLGFFSVGEFSNVSKLPLQGWPLICSV